MEFELEITYSELEDLIMEWLHGKNSNLDVYAVDLPIPLNENGNIDLTISANNLEDEVAA